MSKKILIVEDEKALVKVLSKELANSGFKVISARNGQEGLGLAQTENPDLILLDIVMPVMDGVTMLKKLRQKNDVPVIVLTNLNDKEHLEQAMAAGSYNFLVKSNYSLADIINKINQILSK